MILYQYKPVNKFTLELLINNEFYYPFPKEFNDPFDCISYFTYPQTKENIEKYFKEEEDRNRVEQMRTYLESVNYDTDIIKGIFSPIQDIFMRERFIIRCFSAVQTEILMWSHYSEFHKGICIGFEVYNDTREGSAEFTFKLEENIPYKDGVIGQLPIWKVKYTLSDDIEAFNPIENNVHAMDHILTKNNRWNYEEEYRSVLLYEDVNTQFIKFDKGILKEIIFGLDTSEEDMKTIKTIATGKYPNVKYKKTNRMLGKYKLEISDIS